MTVTTQPAPVTTPATIRDRKTVRGVVAEFSDTESLLAACRRVRDAGYTKADAFTPFPVHGIDKALGIKPTILPWISLGGGFAGICIALTMQIWMNGINYPYIISGKPYISLPAFIPVTFELAILLAAFGTFFGMWALNGLPRFSNPMFTNPRFDRATDDTFFLYLDAKDSRFNEAGAKNLLADLGGQFIEPVIEDDSPKTIPKGLLVGLAALIALSLIPALVVVRMRVTKSSMPRFHVFPDMDFSPAKDAQQVTTLFADGRTSRPDVPGTVSRGVLDWDLDFQSGIDMQELARVDAPQAQRLVAMMRADDPTAEPTEADVQPEAAQPEAAQPEATKVVEAPADITEEPAAVAAQPDTLDSAVGAVADPNVDTTPYLKKNPVELTTAVLEKGQQTFEIYCAVCHGINGTGNGLVNRRAQQILATTWTPPSNLHDETLYQDAYPDGKLFGTISHGIRKMPGYSAQIKAHDRWAVVAYVRALQESWNGTLDDVPADQRDKLKKLQAEVKARIAKAAAAEKKSATDEK